MPEPVRIYRAGRPGAHLRRIGTGVAKAARKRLALSTVRSRLTLLYGALFALSGVVLLSVTAVLWGRATSGPVRVSAKVPGRILEIAAPPPLVLAQSGTVQLQGGTVGRVNLSAVSRAVALSEAPSAVRARRARVFAQLTKVAVAQRTSDLHQLLLWAGIALAIVAALALVLGWVAAGRVLRPLKAIAAKVRALSATSLHERLALDGPKDELKELGDTFDELLSRLERSFEAQRRFVANASHELRTPLATMRVALDVAAAKPGPPTESAKVLAARLYRALDQSEGLLERLLVLARAQRGLGGGATSVDLAGLVARALETRAEAIAGCGLVVNEATDDDVVVAGDELLLSRLVDNLVDNAVRHNVEGGTVDVKAAVVDGQAQLVVANGGRRLDDEAVAQLGQPFRRLGQDRIGSADGFGLGLSIVAAIADAHDGHVRLAARPEGGLEAVVELPHASRLPTPRANTLARR